MLRELQSFSTDERGYTIVELIVAMAILVILAITILNGVIGPQAKQVAEKIKDCLKCAMDPNCTSC